MDKFEIFLIIILALAWISHPLSKSYSAVNHSDSINFVVTFSIIIFVVYSVYSFIKSKKNH